jgi:transcriptional regulator with XRE-family HTH domain
MASICVGSYHPVTLNATGCYAPERNRPLRFASQPLRASTLNMRWYERIAAALDARGVSRVEVGRELNMTGQAITLKLQGKRPVSVDELKVLARFAGLSVSEAIGDDAVVIDLKDEQDLIELYRLLSPEQRAMVLDLMRQIAPKPA